MPTYPNGKIPALAMTWYGGFRWAPAMLASFKKANAECGGRLKALAVYRSHAYQADLVKRWNAQGRKPGNGIDFTPAPAGSSPHGNGIAVDVVQTNGERLTAAQRKALAKHGFTQPVPADRNHFVYQWAPKFHVLRTPSIAAPVLIAPRQDAAEIEKPLAKGKKVRVVGYAVGPARSEKVAGKTRSTRTWFQLKDGGWAWAGHFTSHARAGLKDKTSTLPPIADPLPAPPIAEPLPGERPEPMPEPEQLEPVMPLPADTQEDLMPTPRYTQEDLDALAALVKVQEPAAPVIPDKVARPLWIAFAAAGVTFGPIASVAVIAFGANVETATQLATVLTGWTGSLAAVLGLSRYAKAGKK